MDITIVIAHNNKALWGTLTKIPQKFQKVQVKKNCNPRHSVPLEQMYEQFLYFDQKDIDNNNDMPYGSSKNTENSENFDFNTKYNFSQNTKKINTQNIGANNDMGNM